MAKRKPQTHAPVESIAPEEVPSDRAASLATAAEHLGRELLGLLVDEVKELPKHWSALTFVEQDRVIVRLRGVVQGLVRGGLDRILRGHYPAIAATLESIVIKQGILAKVSIAKGTQEWHELADAVGSQVLLVIADPEDYLEGIEEIKAQVDQADLFQQSQVVQTSQERLQPGESFKTLISQMTGKQQDDANPLADPIIDLIGCAVLRAERLGFAVEEGFAKCLTTAGADELFSWLQQLDENEQRDGSRWVCEDRMLPTSMLPRPECVDLPNRRVILPLNRAGQGTPLKDIP